MNSLITKYKDLGKEMEKFHYKWGITKHEKWVRERDGEGSKNRAEDEVLTIL